MRAQFVLRARFLFAGIFLVAVVFVVRLYQLQVTRGSEYRAEATHQYVSVATNLFDRGAIYFTQKNGEKIAAASTKDGYVLALNPQKITDPEELYREITIDIPLDKAEFMVRATRKDDPYEEVAHHISQDAADHIRDKKLPGVQLFREQWRYYPGDRLAAHVLGFVGYGADGKERTGLYGLERYWQAVLNRESDQLYVNFFAELFTNVYDTKEKEARVREGDLVTSIEPAVQHALEDALQHTFEEWHAREIAGIIINPKTGDLYALASLPSYNPNTYADEKNPRVFQDPLIENVYEMGSIIKPLAMAIGLDTGAVTPETTYNDTGRLKIDGYTISNYDGRARGVVSMQEVLNQSLNVGMAFVARKVGGKVLGERMHQLGFGEETGIDLPFETHGLVTNLDSPREVEHATAAFGQGIALTPIATARALCALGNGGYLITPHVVQSIEYTGGGVGNVSIDDHEQVFSQKTSEEITRMLVTVVDKALRNGAVKKEHYSIAAKTGTAQIATKGGYYKDRYLHSFFGYFPAYDPRFLIFLFHTEPQGAQYASETLTAPFMELVDFLINYYDIPPDR